MIPSLIDTSPDHWTRDAMCAQTDSDLWHPDRGAHSPDAIKTCLGCPARRSCLDDAMTRELGLSRSARFGIQGGMYPSQREKHEPQWLSERGVAA